MIRTPRCVPLLMALVLLSTCRFAGNTPNEAAHAPPPAIVQVPSVTPLTRSADLVNVAFVRHTASPSPAPALPSPIPPSPSATATTSALVATTEIPATAQVEMPPTPVAQAIIGEPAEAQAPAPLVDRRPVHIRIETIGLDRELVPVGLTLNNVPVVPDHDAAWYTLSATPGGGENVVIWGHALRFVATPDRPAPFERVKEARIGDTITIVSADSSEHRYVIQEQIWATPDQVRYILPQGREQLTLVNCIGEVVVVGGVVDMTHRLITIALPV